MPVIELPEWSCDGIRDPAYDTGDVHAAISKAGYKYTIKGE